ncbi:MAG: hypothetical protein WC625_06745 [Caldisericia bacterium]
MASKLPRKTVALPSDEAVSPPEAASERLRNLLEVFGLLVELRKKAQEHHAGKRVYELYVRHPLPHDPGKQDILLNVDESENYPRFVFNATIVFVVSIMDDLLESLERILMKNGNQDLVAKVNAIIGDKCPKSGQGKGGSTQKPGVFRRRYVLVSLYLGLMEEQEARDALKQTTNRTIRDKCFPILGLYQKRCAIVHDDPLADTSGNPVDDYVSAYRFVQRLAQKWNESFPHALNHEPTTGAS